jgi:glycosyltransferase involved in cell wall biosynthesis
MPGAEIADIADIPGQLHPLLLKLLKVLTLRYRPQLGEVISQVMLSSLHSRLVERKMLQAMRQSPQLDAVISIFDFLSKSASPQYIYYDLCVAELRRVLSDPLQGRYERMAYSPSLLKKREHYQRTVFRESAGLFAMSEYAARTTAAAYGIDPGAIHVVRAGCNVNVQAQTERPMQKQFVLFVGRDFKRKGGELLLDAYEHVQKHHDVDVVIAGPAEWMRQGPVPDGVHLLGNAPLSQLSSYFQHAQLFIMPSYYEAFGIAFAEALCYGVPVIARNSCAMPEIVRHGQNGYLLGAESESPAELAELVNTALANTRMKHDTEQQAAKAREYYSWDRVAADMLSVVRKNLSRNDINAHQ